MPVALVTFVAPHGRVVAAGEIVADDDPVLVGREALFDVTPPPGVEQATRAPGERRPRRRG